MSSAAALTTEHVDLSFGGNEVLKDLSLSFQPGEITGLIGPNGAGKTSFFNCLTGHYRPSRGRIKLGDETINAVPTVGRARRGIVRTFQHAALCSELTLLENVIVGLNTSRRSGWVDAILPLPSRLSDREGARSAGLAALDRVGLRDRAEVRADVAAPGVMRLVELARASVGDPKVILLDEPAAGLNSTETAELSGMIRRLRSPERVVIVVEHDMELIMGICDRIHVLNFGAAVASGTPTEIQRDPRVAEIYLGSSDV
jgi:branched-chain amino acid transport system ATP-binding protein